jgi:hypothetical protein
MLALIKKIRIILNMDRGIGSRPKNQKELLMSNYTDSMVSELTKIGAFDYASAQAFAEKHNLSARSVISKVKSLGLEYTAKPKAARKAKSDEPTKAAVLAGIRSALALPDREGDLTKAELSAILASLG